ncbi:MAG: filamentous hemagglutinin N-terminal domain-containing protein [Paracoccaceae bacterium]|nr:filamentous hemagglutinin N-terminal domain-containing protein [Paracoccaceae bacterium]
MRSVLLTSVCSSCFFTTSVAQELPQGGTVAHGDVVIGQSAPGSMTIRQGSDSAIVNWNSFSVGAGAHVDIRQPNSSSTILNRVSGATTSEIHGRLTANGQVHLVNPNGILIGPNGSVSAGSFVASSLSIADDDFLAGRFRYNGDGNSATVENQGRVSIGRGGYAALLGGRIKNSGTITVPMGKIAFGSGERIVLDLDGDQFLQVALPTVGEDGDDALIDNSGLASAQGGRVEMRAATAREAVRQAVNLSGVAEAQSVSVHNGAIILGGGKGGKVNVTGRIRAGGQASTPSPDVSIRPLARPSITITGDRIELAGAEIDASAAGGGGIVRIGGDFGGVGDMPRATEVTVDERTSIRADALGHGDGGRVVIWSELRTEYSGFGSVRGGDNAGDGGFYEVSSRETLRYAGLTDRRAPKGRSGELLLDPRNIVVGTGTGAENEVDIEADLELGDVTLDTSDALGQQQDEAGDIFINADLDWNAATQLTLTADNDIFVNSSITANAGSVDLNAGQNISINGAVTASPDQAVDGLTVSAGGTITATGDVDVGRFFLGNGDWQQFNTTAEFSANSFGLNQSLASFARTRSAGDPDLPPLIFDVYGLQGIGTFGSSFTLAQNIDESGLEEWGIGNNRGFQPIEGFTGTFDGNGFAVSGLFQNIVDGDGGGDGNQGARRVGLFETIEAGATVRDLTIEGADFTGSTGGILADTNNGTIRNVRVLGTLETEGEQTGGLVGINRGLIEDSLADISVNVGSSGFEDRNSVGGFAGQNFGRINRSHALGDINISNDDNVSNSGDVLAGGFVGEELGVELLTINDSYAQGSVTISNGSGSESTPVIVAGGFVGLMNGTINRSYSTGEVLVSGDAITSEGGFAGATGVNASGSRNFWDEDTSGQATSAFGTALSTAEFQDTETFIGLASRLDPDDPPSWDFGTTWAPGDEGFYPANYTTTPVILIEPVNEPVPTVQYGLSGEPFTSTVFSPSPLTYVFAEEGDSVGDVTVFTDLEPGAPVGLQTYRIETEELESVNGVTYRIVDRPGVVEITAAPLTIIADDDTKTYGEFFTPSNFTVSGTIFFDDSVESVALASDGSAVQAAVDPGEASYSIVATEDGASGSGLDNYDITFVSGTLTINPAPLTITPDQQVKAFGETFVFAGDEFTTSGFAVPGDGINEISLSSLGAPSEADVGDYSITIGDFSGVGLENYLITEGTGTLVVQSNADDFVPRPEVITPAGLPDPPDVVDFGDDLSGFFPATGEFLGPDAAQSSAEVLSLSDALDIAADACGQGGGDVGRYLACLSDALDSFAGELDAIALDLPPSMENIAQIVRDASLRINAAATRATARLATAETEAERRAIQGEAASEARAALAIASAEIRSAITLVRADDPQSAEFERATILSVADAIDTLGSELERVSDL